MLPVIDLFQFLVIWLISSALQHCLVHICCFLVPLVVVVNGVCLQQAQLGNNMICGCIGGVNATKGLQGCFRCNFNHGCW